MEKLRSIFSSPFLVMYSVALVIWQNFIKNISFFTAFSAAYTEEVANDAIKAIEAARLLPDASARRAESKRLRALLRVAGKKCCNNFLALLAYIEKSFPATEWEALKQAAGYDAYARASRGSIKQILALNTAALSFITDNKAALEKGTMPAEFITTITGDADDFSKLNDSYTAAVQLQREETNTKTEANIAVYTTLVNMLKDARVIFMNDPATLAFFTYRTIALRFKKVGKTGYRFTIKESGSKAPVASAPILVQPGNITLITNAKGVTQIELKKDILYTITVIAPGYSPVMLADQPVKPGVMARKNITLTKLVIA